MKTSSTARRARVWGSILLAATACMASPATAKPVKVQHDTVIRNGLIYDGSGKPPFVGDVAIDGDRISYVGPHAPGTGRAEIDAHGKAVSPGFINMLAHPEESLLVDKRALSDITQGVTLEVMGEDSMGPLTPAMKADMTRHQGDLHYDIDWTTLGEYLEKLQSKGISPNVAAFVGAAPYASMCWAKIMCSRPRRSCCKCADWSARRCRRGRWV